MLRSGDFFLDSGDMEKITKRPGEMEVGENLGSYQHDCVRMVAGGSKTNAIKRAAQIGML